MSEINQAPAAPEPAVPPPASGDPPDVNWDDLADDSYPVEESPTAPEPEPPATPEPGPSSPAPTPAPAAPPVVAPPQQPVQVAAPVTTPPPAVTTASPVDPAQQAAAVRDALHGELSKLYGSELDQETKDALVTDPAAVMPKLLARAAMDGAQLAMRMVLQTVPQMIVETNAVSSSRAAAENLFYGTHKDLAKPEYRQAVVNAAQMVKAMKVPGQTAEQAMAAVARTARAALGLSEPAVVGSGSPPVPASAPVAPFNPVARGGPAPSAPRKGQGGIDWAALASDDT